MQDLGATLVSRRTRLTLSSEGLFKLISDKYRGGKTNQGPTCF